MTPTSGMSWESQSPSGQDSGPGTLTEQAQVVRRSLSRIADLLRPELEQLSERAVATPAPAESTATDGSAAAETRSAVFAIGSHEALVWLGATIPDLQQREHFASLLLSELDPKAREVPPPSAAEARAILSARMGEAGPAEELIARITAVSQASTQVVLFGGPLAHLGDPTPRPEDTARLRRRWGAYLIDQSIVFTVTLVVVVFLALAGVEITQAIAQLIAFAAIFAFALANSALIARTGASLGKHALRLRVVRGMDGMPLRMVESAGREFVGRFINGISLGIGYLVGVRHPLHQTLGDRWANTVVVHDRAGTRWTKPVRWVGAMTLLLWGFYGPGQTMTSRSEVLMFKHLGSELDSVASVRESLFTFVTRPVATAEELKSDMLQVLRIAPTIHAHMLRLRADTRATLQAVDVFKPWVRRQYVQADSLVMLLDRRSQSATDFAMWTLAREQSVGTERRNHGRRAEYAFSDYMADTRHIARLESALRGGSVK